MRTGIATVPLDYKKSYLVFDGIKSISDEPKIPLKNYLLDLVEKSDGKKSSIYLKGVEKFIQEIWAEMVRDNWKTLRVRRFVPEQLGIHQMMLYDYKNGKKAISIQMMYKLLKLWKNYCRKNNRDIEEKWNEIYKSNFTFSVHKGLVPTKLPRYISPKLSYLMGWLCGDGHMIDYGNHYLIKVSEKSLKELYLLKFLFTHLFGISPPIFQIYKGGYALQFGNKPIFRFLTRVLKIKVGEIPQLVYDLDEINKKFFLMGIFDSEGNVSTSYLDSKVAITQADYRFLKKVAYLFKNLDINCTGPYLHKTKLGTWYTIRIRKKSEILKYINKIGTCHIDKIKKLKFLEKEIYAHGHSYIAT